ncbi:3512_t:CDS:2 [Ambispora gerdemannii]|uniref:3512_t:CDS:1 n=1 Tax=Ambispora gerdemannii TaxID=144530 RepID=A0A9N9CXK9_9GLOM|nr:3512_t:CDS:2 [Ambispora gerdemannii]
MTTPLPPGLTLNERETEVFNGLSRRQLRAFNALPDNPSKVIFIQAIMTEQERDRQKSNEAEGSTMVGETLPDLVFLNTAQWRNHSKPSF